MTLKEWLGDGVVADGDMILRKSLNSTQLIADIRGYGALEKHFRNGTKAFELQEEVAKFIADAINEKLERENNDIQRSAGNITA